MRSHKNSLLWSMPVLIAISILASGCATMPYKYGQNIEYQGAYKLPEGEPQVERGRPNGFLDSSGWIYPGSLLGKLMLWNKKVDSHRVSKESEEALVKYLKANDLDNVKVRINQYSPGGEWRRTFRNKAVGAGWRYTLGFLSWLGYTVLPQRFFGGDNYNPYSNTINIYSDHPAIAIHEGGHSKDFKKRKDKGLYSFVYAIPFVSLYHEAQASNDALGYMRANAAVGDQENAYKILYPAYATYLGGGSNGGYLLGPLYYPIVAGAMIPAHIIGRVKAGQITEPASSQ